VQNLLLQFLNAFDWIPLYGFQLDRRLGRLLYLGFECLRFPILLCRSAYLDVVDGGDDLSVSSIIRLAVSFTFLGCFEEAFVNDAGLSEFLGKIVDEVLIILSQLLSFDQLLPFGENLVSCEGALAMAMLVIALEVE
jgi:hypothetical protein